MNKSRKRGRAAKKMNEYDKWLMFAIFEVMLLVGLWMAFLSRGHF